MDNRRVNFYLGDFEYNYYYLKGRELSERSSLFYVNGYNPNPGDYLVLEIQFWPYNVWSEVRKYYPPSRILSYVKDIIIGYGEVKEKMTSYVYDNYGSGMNRHLEKLEFRYDVFENYLNRLWACSRTHVTSPFFYTSRI